MLFDLRSRLLIRLGMVLIMLLVVSAPVKAAPSDARQAFRALGYGDRTAPVKAAPSDAEQAFRTLGYGDRTARSLDGSLEYFFPIPPGQSPLAGSQITLSFSHSPLLIADLSTMTIVVNDQSLASILLTDRNSDHAQLVVPLPHAGADGMFRATGYFVQVQFNMRLTRADCEESSNPALWTTVHDDSRLLLRTAPASDSPGLSALSKLFAPTQNHPLSLTLTLPPSPQPEEIQAAGLVAFQAGRWAAATGSAHEIAIAHARPADQPGVLIAGGSALAALGGWDGLQWDGGAFIAKQARVPADHGLLALRATTPELLVSGGTPAAVLDAAAALVQPERRALLTGSMIALSGRPPAPLPDVAPWRNGAASFAQLGIDQQRVTGPGEHVIDLTVERPAGWILREGAALDLDIASAIALRSDTSWVAISINGYTLGSRRLEAAADSVGRRFHFDLPADLLNADSTGQPLRQLALQIRLFLDLPQTPCDPITASSTWATLLPTSFWSLPHDTFDGLDLARFPSPLLSESGAPLLVVLPEGPTDAELEAGLNLLAALGRWATPAPPTPPRLITADHADAAALQQSNVILIGGVDRNSASAAAAQHDGDLFAAVMPVAYQLDDRATTGQLRLASSPWSNSYSLLILTSDAPDGLKLAAQALSQGALLERLRGEQAIIAAGLPPQTVVGSTPEEGIPPALAPQVIIPLTQRLPIWQIVGAILLGALVAAMVVIVLTRWRRRPGKEERHAS
jgi:cellulose synthase operon protein B